MDAIVFFRVLCVSLIPIASTEWTPKFCRLASEGNGVPLNTWGKFCISEESKVQTSSKGCCHSDTPSFSKRNSVCWLRIPLVLNPIRCEEKNCGLLWGMGSHSLISMYWCAGLHRGVWLPKCAWKSLTYIWIMVWNSLTGKKSGSWLSMQQYDLLSHELTEVRWWTGVCDVLCSVVWISFVTVNLTPYLISPHNSTPYMTLSNNGNENLRKKVINWRFCIVRVCDQTLQGWWSSGKALSVLAPASSKEALGDVL